MELVQHTFQSAERIFTRLVQHTFQFAQRMFTICMELVQHTFQTAKCMFTIFLWEHRLMCISPYVYLATFFKQISQSYRDLFDHESSNDWYG